MRFEWMVLPIVFLYVALATAASSHAGEAWVEPGTRRGAVAEAGRFFATEMHGVGLIVHVFFSFLTGDGCDFFTRGEMRPRIDSIIN